MCIYKQHHWVTRIGLLVLSGITIIPAYQRVCHLPYLATTRMNLESLVQNMARSLILHHLAGSIRFFMLSCVFVRLLHNGLFSYLLLCDVNIKTPSLLYTVVSLARIVHVLRTEMCISLVPLSDYDCVSTVMVNLLQQ